MNSDELLKNEALVRTEADAVLESLQLIPHLAQFGEVEIEGAYGYKLMVDRDIDLGLAVPSLDTTNNTKIRESVGAFILAHPSVTKLKIVDYIAAPPPPGKPDGIWFGITFLLDQHEWSFDLWITRSNKKHGLMNAGDLPVRLLDLPDETRATILFLKNHVHQNHPRTYHSIAIYEAVLDQGIKDVDNLMAYLEQRQGAKRPKS